MRRNTHYKIRWQIQIIFPVTDESITDRDEFLKAMQKESDSHMTKDHYELIDRDAVPEGENVLNIVWSMKRKRNILTNAIFKYKSRLNIHDKQQEYAKNFYERYSHVVPWFSIRLLLIHVIILRWSTRQIDFTTAFPKRTLSSLCTWRFHLESNWKVRIKGTKC